MKTLLFLQLGWRNSFANVYLMNWNKKLWNNTDHTGFKGPFRGIQELLLFCALHREQPHLPS